MIAIPMLWNMHTFLAWRGSLVCFLLASVLLSGLCFADYSSLTDWGGTVRLTKGSEPDYYAENRVINEPESNPTFELSPGDFCYFVYAFSPSFSFRSGLSSGFFNGRLGIDVSSSIGITYSNTYFCSFECEFVTYYQNRLADNVTLHGVYEPDGSEYDLVILQATYMGVPAMFVQFNRTKASETPSVVSPVVKISYETQYYYKFVSSFYGFEQDYYYNSLDSYFSAGSTDPGYHPDYENPTSPESPGATEPGDLVVNVDNSGVEKRIDTTNEYLYGIGSGLRDWHNTYADNESAKLQILADFKVDVGNGFTALLAKDDVTNGYLGQLVDSNGNVLKALTDENSSALLARLASIANNGADVKASVNEFKDDFGNYSTDIKLKVDNAVDTLGDKLDGISKLLKSANNYSIYATTRDIAADVKATKNNSNSIVSGMDDLRAKVAEIKSAWDNGQLSLDDLNSKLADLNVHALDANADLDAISDKLIQIGDYWYRFEGTFGDKMDDAIQSTEDVNETLNNIDTNLQNNNTQVNTQLNNINQSIQNLGDSITVNVPPADYSWFQSGQGNTSASGGALDLSSDGAGDYVDYDSDYAEISSGSYSSEFVQSGGDLIDALSDGSSRSDILYFQLPEWMGGSAIYLPTYASLSMFDSGKGEAHFIDTLLRLLGALLGLVICLHLISWAYDLISR